MSALPQGGLPSHSPRYPHTPNSYGPRAVPVPAAPPPSGQLSHPSTPKTSPMTKVGPTFPSSSPNRPRPKPTAPANTPRPNEVPTSPQYKPPGALWPTHPYANNPNYMSSIPQTISPKVAARPGSATTPNGVAKPGPVVRTSSGSQTQFHQHLHHPNPQQPHHYAPNMFNPQAQHQHQYPPNPNAPTPTQHHHHQHQHQHQHQSQHQHQPQHQHQHQSQHQNQHQHQHQQHQHPLQATSPPHQHHHHHQHQTQPQRALVYNTPTSFQPPTNASPRGPQYYSNTNTTPSNMNNNGNKAYISPRRVREPIPTDTPQNPTNPNPNQPPSTARPTYSPTNRARSSTLNNNTQPNTARVASTVPNPSHSSSTVPQRVNTTANTVAMSIMAMNRTLPPRTNQEMERSASLSKFELPLRATPSFFVQGRSRSFSEELLGNGTYQPVCQNCKNAYNASEGEGGQPLILECQHTFCEPCVKKSIKDSNVVCPKCSKKTPVPSQGTVALRHNYALSELNQVDEEVLQRQPTCAVLDAMGATCPVCMEEYFPPKLPYLLRCGHSACDRCLRSMVQSRRSTKICCPVCNVEHDLSIQEEVSVNVALKRAVDTVLAFKRKNKEL